MILIALRLNGLYMIVRNRLKYDEKNFTVFVCNFYRSICS